VSSDTHYLAALSLVLTDVPSSSSSDPAWLAVSASSNWKKSRSRHCSEYLTRLDVDRLGPREGVGYYDPHLAILLKPWPCLYGATFCSPS
jgi:hypothetical protein